MAIPCAGCNARHKRRDSAEKGSMSELKFRPPKEKSGWIGSCACIPEMERVVIPRIPPYPPPFSYEGGKKDLQAESLYEGETLELAGICLRKSEGKTKR